MRGVEDVGHPRPGADELELAHVRNHGVPIKDGLLEVLERLRKYGLTMAVATSSRRAIAATVPKLVIVVVPVMFTNLPTAAPRSAVEAEATSAARVSPCRMNA